MSGPSLAEIQRRLERFRDERDWSQFHSLSNLAAAISVEAGELLELFLWSPPADETEIVAGKRDEIEAELADVFIQCLNFAASAEIDLLEAVNRKIDHNGENYPASHAKGKATKYTEL
jgi:NTP pyrophosphatase (non-canonical NTP hydrolase)